MRTVNLVYSVKCVCCKHFKYSVFLFIYTNSGAVSLRYAAVCVCVVWEWIGVRSQPHRGSPWWGPQSPVWGVTAPMNSDLFAPSHLRPLISGRPIVRRVPGPSGLSFPHGKYLTLTVAHVCHIICRFRGKKTEKKLVCRMMMELHSQKLKFESSVVS